MKTGDVISLVMNILTITTILGGISIGFRKWLKHWIRDVARQLETTNGHTVGQYTEKTAHDMVKVKSDMQELRKDTGQSELVEMRLKALEERLDNYLRSGENRAA